MRITTRHLVLFIIGLFCPIILSAQSLPPVFVPQSISMLPPSMDAAGHTIVFGSSINSDGSNLGATDIFTASPDGGVLRRLTQLANPTLPIPSAGATSVCLAANGTRAAYTTSITFSTTTPPAGSTGPSEQIHVIDIPTGSDRAIPVDTSGCALPPAALCFGCSFSCLRNPHLTADGSKVLFTTSRERPFSIVNSDGIGLTQLPIYSGTIAASSQRVISNNRLVVFTSSAPFGPTFAAAPTDVYVMNLDGSNIRNISKFGADATLSATNATISADGMMIAYLRFHFTHDSPNTQFISTSLPEVWITSIDGSISRRVALVAGFAANPSISGDGSLIAFTDFNGHIMIVHSDGTGLKSITDFKTSVPGDPVISEDGSTIVFGIGPPGSGVGGTNSSLGAIYVINSDGTNLRPVYAPRSLNTSGIIGLTTDSGFIGAPSPGSLFSAYGLNLGPEAITVAEDFPLPDTLAGVSLLANGKPVPLTTITPWQINAQLPSDVNPGTVNFQLKFANGQSPVAITATVPSLAPLIFNSIEISVSIEPGGATALTRSIVANAFHAGSTQLVDSSHPAVAGEVIEVYGSGLGHTTPAVTAGFPAPSSPPTTTLAVPHVIIENVPAQVLFSGLTPRLVGVYQINFVVPSGLAPGLHTMQWRLDENTSSNVVQFSVQ